MNNKATLAVAVALAALLVAAPCNAGDLSPQAFAARTGISFSPDQFNGGLHLQLGSSSKPQLRPALEVGLGNGVRLLSLSGDVLYHFDGGHWRPYAGAGPGVNFIDVTDGVGEADGMKAKLVARAVAGITWAPRRSRHRYFVEGLFGVGDTPDFRVALGVSF